MTQLQSTGYSPTIFLKGPRAGGQTAMCWGVITSPTASSLARTSARLAITSEPEAGAHDRQIGQEAHRR